MAITYTCRKLNPRVVQAKWETITENDTPDAFENPGYPDVNAQVTGTYGGATIALHGSNDGTNYAVLQDSAGNNILISSGSANYRIDPAPKYIKPVRTGGSSTDLDVVLICYK